MAVKSSITLSAGPSVRIRTNNHRIMSKVFDNCATRAQLSYCKLQFMSAAYYFQIFVLREYSFLNEKKIFDDIQE
jgi:hypothetical protein